MRISAVAFVLIAVLFGVALVAEAPPLDHLTDAYLTGSFGSAVQAATDPEHRYIRLHIAPLRPDRTDGCWLHVEQAPAAAPDKQYRQRVSM